MCLCSHLSLESCIFESLIGWLWVCKTLVDEIHSQFYLAMWAGWFPHLKIDESFYFVAQRSPSTSYNTLTSAQRPEHTYTQLESFLSSLLTSEFSGQSFVEIGRKIAVKNTIHTVNFISYNLPNCHKCLTYVHSNYLKINSGLWLKSFGFPFINSVYNVI